MAALSRMAADVHRKVTIQPNDTIIFSSNPIPGNEKSVSRVINELSAKGANVIFQDAHVSGHACQEELKLIYSLVKPKYALPVHGEYRHLKANAAIASSLGIPKENIFIMQSGDVMELSEDEAGFIALHIVNGQLHLETKSVREITTLMQQIETIVRMRFAITLDPDSVYYYRFITHLKFFAERIFSEKQIPTKEMDGLLELIREKYPQDVECVLDIAAFLKQRYGYTLSEEEILYLSIHVSRIHQVSVKGGEAV